ncbi:hypothetical protein M8756_02370 [Lutimaribacter sp. EGI FJ00015]|uniref:Uncharacterized protein n=1 Tax=Lutimaribacter degradans TaxID=2945989 RepID=A0ACC5ZT17_9RHOB|nr:hypothetical protein [Lutimaribacter sp. EGI FJ00013]MCM2560916.1 hypothetical protein [Lutimaribacter sp. EGI FJ00013]MCO0612139.1 hypothetical protein [Lutimaribacter sp. EGI FJ00015]MCO0634741.1 hypothetical protein [Lutimaribacter sp. EGI FJ00014]
MQIVLHAGAHNTDEDRLVKCLLRNRDDFRQRGIAVPGPSRYRRLLRDTLHAMSEGALAPDARNILMDAMLEDEQPERVLLSNDNFFSVPKLAVSKGVFYPRAEVKMAQVTEIFERDQVELFLAIRNPATFLPAVFSQAPDESMDEFLAGADPQDLRWSELVARIRDHVPGIAITVWCNEDTPLIWAQLIREMAGLEHNEKIVGGFDLLSEIMSKTGMKRFRAYLKEHPNMNEIQKRRVIAAFLDKFAIDDEIEEELDLPGWTEELVDTLTEQYDDDVFDISRMQGVTMIAP